MKYQKYQISVQNLDIPPRMRRAINASQFAGATVGEILQTPPRDLIRLKNFGRGSWHALIEGMRKAGVPKDEIERWCGFL
jgi:hypothetical protein